jgi:two-component system LytT family response regulator
MIRALLADDEPLAREGLRAAVAGDHEIAVVGEARDGFEAVRAVEELAPDLLFLDVEMPGLDGFGVLDALRELEALPLVVFVTAFDHYAVRAFEVAAVDYVLKPFSPARVREALARAKARLKVRSSGESTRAIENLLERLQPQREPLRWLLVPGPRKSFFLKTEDVDWIEAARNDVVLHAGEAEHLFPASLKTMAACLDPRRFVRIHRSAVVNVEAVRELSPIAGGDWSVRLRTGRELRMSAAHREALLSLGKLPAASSSSS